MPKVEALEHGYWGNVLREPGERFFIDNDVWSDKKSRPGWVRKVGSDPEPTATAEVGASATSEIPDNWKTLGAAERKEIAQKISGAPVANGADANEIIETHLSSIKNPSNDDASASEPETKPEGNGVDEALGNSGPRPDYLPTEHTGQSQTAPVMADD